MKVSWLVQETAVRLFSVLVEASRTEWKFEKVAECNSDQLMRDLAPATSGHCRGSFSWADWGPGRLVVNASINVARAKAGVANAAAFVTQFSL